MMDFCTLFKFKKTSFQRFQILIVEPGCICAVPLIVSRNLVGTDLFGVPLVQCGTLCSFSV